MEEEKVEETEVESEVKYRCSICMQGYKTLTGIENHMEAEHPDSADRYYTVLGPDPESESEPEPEPEEEKCECYSVDPPKQPWRSTFAFGTYQCKLCGRRRKK